MTTTSIRPRVILCPTRADWHARRHEGLGSSEVAALVGESPYHSLASLWAEKRAPAKTDDADADNRMKAGTFLEPGIAAWYAHETGHQIIAPQELEAKKHNVPVPHAVIYRRPDMPFLQSTPDRFIVMDGTLWVFEIKNADKFNDAEWKNGPPLKYQVQVQHQLGVQDLQRGVLCVLIGGNDIRWFEIERNDKFIAALWRQAERFWIENVLGGKAPPMDGNEHTKKALKALYPVADPGSVVDLSGKRGLLSNILAAQKKRKQASDDYDQLMNELMLEMGTCESAEIDGSIVATWKPEKRAIMQKVGETTERKSPRLKDKAIEAVAGNPA